MKRVLYALLCAVLLLGLCSCADNTEDVTPEPTRTPTPTPNGDRIVLTVGTIGSSFALTGAVDAFNSENRDYEFRIVNYLELATYDAADAMYMMKVDLELGLLDAVSLFSQYTSTFARAGALEDLYPYIDADTELNREDFVAGILAGMEVNGALYSFSPDFFIVSAAGLAENVGTDMLITTEKLRAVRGELPKGSSYFGPDITRREFLKYMYCVSGDSFIDWENWQGNFESDGFVRTLELALDLPAEVSPQQDGGEASVYPWEVEAALEIEEIRSLHASRYQSGRTVTYTGLPISAEMNAGHAAVPASAEVGMAVGSQYKKEVWSLLRRLLTEDNQLNLAARRFRTSAPFLPLNRNALERMAKETTMPGGDFYLDNWVTTEEASAQKIELIESVENVYRDGWSLDPSFTFPVIEIILEEAEHYFEGRRTAQEAAVIIQSRVWNEYLRTLRYEALEAPISQSAD